MRESVINRNLNLLKPIACEKEGEEENDPEIATKAAVVAYELRLPA